MQTTERPIDLSAARKARASVPLSSEGDRWAGLHGLAPRPVKSPRGPGAVIQFTPMR